MSISFGSNIMNQYRQELQRIKKQQYNEVYAHELKHKQAAGSFGGPIVIERGANGMVTGGHVDIKMPVLDKSDPKSTINHADIVIKAAMAPDEPSEQDYKVAAEARTIKAKAENCQNKDDSCGQKLNLVA